MSHISTSDDFTPSHQIKLFQLALKIHIADKNIRKLITSGAMHPVYHPPSGQELIAAAMGSLLNRSDYLCTIYRGLHDQIAKGMPLKLLLAEYFMKSTGACKGKGGAMHITHTPSGIMVTTGVVGSSMPIANGLAWASQLNGDNRVTVASFGDGASNIGAFHESLNLASVWKLPIVFLCQNNRYQECTQYQDTTSCEKISDRAQAYGNNLIGITADGNDAKNIWSAMKFAIDRARRGEGPTLLEANTFRLNGHYFGDPSSYIPKQELETAKNMEPLARFQKHLIQNHILSEKQISDLESEFLQEFNAAVMFAKESPEPEPQELYTDIYNENINV